MKNILCLFIIMLGGCASDNNDIIGSYASPDGYQVLIYGNGLAYFGIKDTPQLNDADVLKAYGTPILRSRDQRCAVYANFAFVDPTVSKTCDDINFNVTKNGLLQLVKARRANAGGLDKNAKLRYEYSYVINGSSGIDNISILDEAGNGGITLNHRSGEIIRVN